MKIKRSYILLAITFAIISIIYFSFTLRSNDENQKSTNKSSLQIDSKYKYGKRLYEKNCVGCHDAKMTEYATAPPLGGITGKREKKWLYNYTRNSQKMLADSNKIAIKLKSENFGLMPSFPTLDDKKLDAIYYYVEEEYKKNK